MKKTLLTVAAVGFLCAVRPASATTISNTANGLSLSPFGTPNTVTYGEVFTAPITGTLSSFTLSLDSPGVTNLYGGIGVWGGSFPTSTLYTSSTVGASGGGAFTFSPDVAVTAGTGYVAYLSVYGISSSGITDMPQGSQASDLFGFTFWNTFNGTDWTGPNGSTQNALFSATFDSPTAVLEPGTGSLLWTGIIALVLLRCRARRRSAAT